jgi:serine/threonine protein kinase
VSFLNTLKSLFKSKPKSDVPIIDVNKRFELIGRTGQGSMSKVWRARDRTTSKIVCVKILDRVKAEKFEARFVGMNRPKEGAICMALRHKNVVTTYEHGLTTDKEQYIVFELIEGMGLNFLIDTGSKDLDKNRVNILSQVADGLDFIHKQRYLHRDLCPRNIMVTNKGVVKIIDFGLAVPFTREFCRPGNRTGTINYLAPELIKRQTTDQRVDLFALGVTAYEMFTGVMPWEKAESLQTLLSHMNTTARDPLDYQPNLDKKVVDFLKKAVDRDPALRFQNAKEFRDALQNLPKGW